MEGDLPVASFLLLFGYFNPLPPHGGRLKGEYSFFAFPEISIHSLRMEGDRKAADPRLPGCAISIHSLRMEGDMATSYVPSGTSLFQSTPSAWRETVIVPTLRLSK